MDPWINNLRQLNNLYKIRPMQSHDTTNVLMYTIAKLKDLVKCYCCCLLTLFTLALGINVIWRAAIIILPFLTMIVYIYMILYFMGYLTCFIPNYLVSEAMIGLGKGQSETTCMGQS